MCLCGVGLQKSYGVAPWMLKYALPSPPQKVSPTTHVDVLVPPRPAHLHVVATTTVSAITHVTVLLWCSAQTIPQSYHRKSCAAVMPHDGVGRDAADLPIDHVELFLLQVRHVVMNGLVIASEWYCYDYDWDCQMEAEVNGTNGFSVIMMLMSACLTELAVHFICSHQATLPLVYKFLSL